MVLTRLLPLILALQFFFYFPIIGQPTNSDSLLRIWNDENLADSIRGDAIYALVWDNYMSSQPDSAIYYSDILLKEAIKEKNTSWEMQALNLMGVYYGSVADYPQAIETFKRKLALSQRLNQQENVARSYNNIGVCYQELGVYDLSLEYYKKCFAVFEKLNHPVSLAITLINIGHIFERTGNFEEAKKSARKAIDLLNQHDKEVETGTAYLILGTTEWRLGNVEQAMSDLNKSIALSEKFNKNWVKAQGLDMLGQVALSINDPANAQAHFSESLLLNKDLKNYKNLASNLVNLGKLALSNNQTDQAISYCQQGLETASDIAVLNEQAEACECLYKAFKQNGDHQQALVYHEKEWALRDSLINEEKIRTLTTIQLNYEHNKEQALMEKEKQYQQTIITMQRRGMYVLTGLFLLVLLGGIVIFVQKKRLESAYDMLMQKNREVLKSEKITKATEKAKTNAALSKNDSTQPNYPFHSLEQKIQYALVEDEIFLDPEITLTKLADQLNTNTSYLSKAINTGFHKNFNSLINEYRIKKVIAYMEDNIDTPFTIESLGKDAGFKSRSAFHNAFKKHTGLTPSFYISKLKEG